MASGAKARTTVMVCHAEKVFSIYGYTSAPKYKSLFPIEINRPQTCGLHPEKKHVYEDRIVDVTVSGIDMNNPSWGDVFDKRTLSAARRFLKIGKDYRKIHR